MRSEMVAGRRLLQLAGPHRKALAKMFLVGACIQALSVVMPSLSRVLIDRAYPARDIPLTQTLLAASVAVIAATVLLQNMQGLLGRLIQANLHLEIAQNLYAHLVELPMDFFHENRLGEISSRFSIIRSSLVTLVTGVRTVARNYGFMLLVPPLLFALNPILAFVATVVIPPIAYLTYRDAVVVYRDMRAYLRRTAEVDSFQSESCAKMRSLKGLHLEQYCLERFQKLIGEAAAVQRGSLKTHTYYNTAANLLRGASLCVCTWLGWRFILAGTLTLGEFVAFMAYFSFLYNPMREVIDSIAAAQEAVVFLKGVADCLDQPSETSTWRAAGPTVLLPRTRDIALDALTFEYGRSLPVFTALNAMFQDGMVTAVIGLSGSGKTTLLQLMIGFSAPQRGRVALGGVDIRRLSLTDLRSQISVVWQEDSLLSTSLWENLTLGSRASRRRVDRVVELCQLSDLVTRLPSGYETVVGDRGVRLSAGQRQRVAIARAMIRDTPVLLFDEVTANIDPASEAHLLRSVIAECRHRLIVLVTHRATTALRADRILHCANGSLKDVSLGMSEAANAAAKRGESVEEAMRVILTDAAVPMSA